MNSNQYVSPIKIVNQQIVQKSKSTNIRNNSDSHDIFVNNRNKDKSPKQSKRLNSNSSLENSNLNKFMKNTSINPCKQFISKNRYDLLYHKDPEENMETNTDTDIIDKKPPPIFTKSTIQNYFSFCESIKKSIEPDFDFFCKSTTGALK
jgi:hypothetical protein